MDVKGKIALKLLKAGIRNSVADRKISDSMIKVYDTLKSQKLFDTAKDELAKELGLKDYIEMNYIMKNAPNKEKIPLAVKMYNLFLGK